MTAVKSFFARLARDEEGVSLVEWSIMVLLVGAIVIAVFTAYRTEMTGAMTALGTCVSDPSATNCTTIP